MKSNSTYLFYPGGMLMPERFSTSGDYRYGYNGMEMDNETSGNGNSYTTEFRQYDPRLMRWSAPDILKYYYPSTSQYCYALNTPIMAKDDNGMYTIFVNGYVYGTTPGKSDDVKSGYQYWRSSRLDKSEFINGAHDYFGDGNHEFVNGSGSDVFSTAGQRQYVGRALGKVIAIELLQKIKDNPDFVKEINIVSHSMGAAFAEGIIEELMKHPELAALLKKGEIVHFSAADADNIEIAANAKDLKRTQLNYSKDGTLLYADGLVGYENGGYQIEGVNRIGIVQSHLKKMHPNYDDNAIKKYGNYDFHFDSKTFKETWDYLKVLDNRIKMDPNNYDKKIRYEDIQDNWDHRDGSTGQKSPENAG